MSCSSYLFSYLQQNWNYRLVWDEQNLRRTDHRWSPRNACRLEKCPSYVRLALTSCWRVSKTLTTARRLCRIVQSRTVARHRLLTKSMMGNDLMSLILIGSDNRDAAFSSKMFYFFYLGQVQPPQNGAKRLLNRNGDALNILFWWCKCCNYGSWEDHSLCSFWRIFGAWWNRYKYVFNTAKYARCCCPK